MQPGSVEIEPGKTALLDRIMRQRGPALLAAVERLSQNRTREGIAMLSAQGRVMQIEDKSARIEAIARAPMPIGLAAASSSHPTM